MKRIMMIVFFVMSMCIPSFASQVTPDECYIYNVGDVQIGRRTSANDAYPVLGEVLSIQPGISSEAYIPLHIICENGSIWIGSVDPNANADTVETVERIIWTKSDVYTTKGIHIGDSIKKVYEAYGYPSLSLINKKPEYNGIVKHWNMYSPTGMHLEHLGFGSSNGIVTAIVVSKMAGGL